MQSPLLDHLRGDITQLKSNTELYASYLKEGKVLPEANQYTSHATNKIVLSLLDIIVDLETRLKAAEEKLNPPTSSASKKLREVIASLSIK